MNRLAPTEHASANHTVSIDPLIKQAHKVCERHGVKLTLLRRQVLSIIWSSEKPIGAYAIMSQLEVVSDREHVAPPTVYRTLEFLQKFGLVHRIHSLNAFIGRSNPSSDHCDTLFVCAQCGVSHEVSNNVIQQSINLRANEMKFEVQQQALEILGRCQQCRQAEKDDHVARA